MKIIKTKEKEQTSKTVHKLSETIIKIQIYCKRKEKNLKSEKS